MKVSFALFSVLIVYLGSLEDFDRKLLSADIQIHSAGTSKYIPRNSKVKDVDELKSILGKPDKILYDTLNSIGTPNVMLYYKECYFKVSIESILHFDYRINSEEFYLAIKDFGVIKVGDNVRKIEDSNLKKRFFESNSSSNIERFKQQVVAGYNIPYYYFSAGKWIETDASLVITFDPGTKKILEIQDSDRD